MGMSYSKRNIVVPSTEICDNRHDIKPCTVAKRLKSQIILETNVIVYGFLARIENNNELFMSIPADIKLLILQYYSRGMALIFAMYNERLFHSSAGGFMIEGIAEASTSNENIVYMIIAQNIDDDTDGNGFNKGVHCWSVKNHGGCRCVGIIGSDKYRIDTVYQTLSSSTSVTSGVMMFWIKQYHIDCAPEDLHYRGKWEINETRTIQLDCTQNKITYFKEFREVKSKAIPNGSYYFAISMSPNQCSGAEIVNRDIFTSR